MKFEDAMKHLRNGERIFRSSYPTKGSLCGTNEKVLGSFYLTIWDILADDWKSCPADTNPDYIMYHVMEGNEDEG